MSDDWRLRVELGEPDDALELKGYLEAAELEHELEGALGERIVISYDNAEVFCYAGSRAQAERAERLIHARAGERGWQIETELKRWHPVAEEWEDPDKPLPASPAEREAERDELIEQERADERGSGYLDWEVRVQLGSHREAVELADELEAEGIPVIRRWRFLVIGAPDEDAANALAERIRAESPPGSIVTPEGSYPMVWSSDPRRWFSFFGGVAG
jgi:hypothetical protein